MGSQPGRATEPSAGGTAPTELADDPLVGSVLDGRYKVEGALGEGGLGRVYRGRHLKLNRRVAIKVLLEEHRARGDIRARFEREAQALSALSHPNIVTVTDFGATDELLYLVMELALGEDLDTLVERDGAMPPARVVGIMTQLLKSLAYAHDEGVIHRDLKLANVHVRSMAEGGDHVEVLDFGLAKFLENEEQPERSTNPKLTRAGMVLGSPAYMAPEQVDGASCDTRTDVYAAGVMLFEMLTGRLPFVYEETTKMLRAHLVETPPKLRDVKPELPVSLETIVSKAMEKSPDDRYANGAEMLHALESASLDTGTFEVVTDRIKGMGEGIKVVGEGLTERVRRFANDERLSSVERSLGEMRGKLPGPLKEFPMWGIGAMIGGLLLLILIVIGTTLAGDEGEKVTRHKVELEQLPEGADLSALGQMGGLDDARDPWEDWESDETLPDELRTIKRVLDTGRRINRRYIGTLRMFSERMPEDCRPVLLRGHAYVNRRWLTGALPEYIEAFERDPSCRGDPKMLRSMVRMAGARTERIQRDGQAALIRIYGDEAEDAIEERIEQANRQDEKERLQALLDLL